VLANKKSPTRNGYLAGLEVKKSRSFIGTPLRIPGGFPLSRSLHRAVSRANRAGDFRTTGVTVSHFPQVPQSSL